MRSTRRNFVWLAAAVAVAAGLVIATQIIAITRQPVTVRVASVERSSGSISARCEMRNRGGKAIEFTMHRLDETPFYEILERGDISWHSVLSNLDFRSFNSWHPAGWDAQCGIDAETRILAPGQTLSFTTFIAYIYRPIRVAVNYRAGGADFVASSRTIRP